MNHSARCSSSVPGLVETSRWVLCLASFLTGIFAFTNLISSCNAQSSFNDDGHAFAREVDELLLDGKYKELNQLADHLRSENPLLPNGRAKLTEFYDTLSTSRGETDQDRLRELHDRIDLLQGWRNSATSITPLIAQAIAHYQIGWLHRGSSYASGVSDEAMRKFRLSLEKANELFGEAERLASGLKVRDPVLFEEWMNVGVGLGFKREQMFSLLDQTLEINPWWFGAVDTMVQYLLPRWHGQPGDLLLLADHAVKKTKAAAGEAAYAIVAINAFSWGEVEEFSQDGFEWNRTRIGINDWLKQAPDSPNRLSQLLKYARLAGDRQTAAEAVVRLNGRWHTGVFFTEIDYLRAERWSRPDFGDGQARKILEGFKSTVYSTAFLENGSVVIGVGRESNIRRFKVDTGDELSAWTTELYLPELSLVTPDGTQLLLAGHHGKNGSELVSMFTKNWKIEKSIGQFPAVAIDLAVDPGGRTLAMSLESGAIRRWALTPTMQPYQWDAGFPNDYARGLAFSPDGSQLAAVGNQEIAFWDIAKRKEIKRWECYNALVTAVAFSPDGKIVATSGAGNEIRLWNPQTAGLIGQLFNGNASICSIAFNTKGDRLVGATRSWEQTRIPGEIVVWSIPDRRKVATLTGHALGILKVAISPDDKTIATASEDGTVRLWDLP